VSLPSTYLPRKLLITNPRCSSFVDIYPFDTLTGGTIVDVGGGKGQVMHSIAARHPDLHFIVQDHSSVVTAGAQECPAELAPRFEWMGYDFFSPQQPVRGAAAYFLRHILHDWSDEYCVRILGPIVEAMLPGGASRLLICDVSFFFFFDGNDGGTPG
jgi:hypothetical protein